ncbi:hypothetical protein [Cyanophage S-TIM54]|nr:hypothetical protein [Cyanophage S-TIM54]
MTKAIELSQLGSNLDVGTEVELSLPLRTNNAIYGNNTDVPYLIAGTTGYTGATTNWNTFGIQHRFKSNSGGTPRVTIDAGSGELFSISYGGFVHIGNALTSSGTGRFNVKPHNGHDSYFKIRSASDFDSSITGSAIDIRNANNTATDHLVVRAEEYRLWTHTGEKIRIDSLGNVGIGTNSPGVRLHVHSGTMAIAMGGVSANVTYGGRSIHTHHDVRSTSMRGGVLVRNMNDFRSETDSASFMHYDAYTSSAKSYAFRVSRGATLSDTFWVKSDGSMYAASTFSGNSISLTSNITQTANAPQHIFRETGTTHGTTSWALVRDGDSFSIRWNNAFPYAFRAATSGGNLSSVYLRHNGLEVNSSGTVIAGSLSKGSGSFRIQHPLSELSETTDLVHSFVEAPDASNLYAGMVQLTDGVAVVNIDTAHRMTEGTFVALNHVQSWSSSNESGYAPVKCSISGNLLTIECQDTNSTDTVYYEVRGIRKDQHMIDTDWTDNEGRVITEPPKRVIPE